MLGLGKERQLDMIAWNDIATKLVLTATSREHKVCNQILKWELNHGLQNAFGMGRAPQAPHPRLATATTTTHIPEIPAYQHHCHTTNLTSIHAFSLVNAK